MLSWKARARMIGGDALERVRYGRAAPRWAERVWIDPRRCVTVAPALDRGRRHSGRVVGGDWVVAPIETVEKLRMAEEHWRTGASWEDVGAYDYLMAHVDELHARDGYRTREDLARRFARLDELFETVRRERRLRPRSEMPGWSIREHQGVYVHIAPDGSPVFGNGGCHRLAAAWVLELGSVPAQLGAVHPHALEKLPRLRSPIDG